MPSPYPSTSHSPRKRKGGVDRPSSSSSSSSCSSGRSSVRNGSSRRSRAPSRSRSSRGIHREEQQYRKDGLPERFNSKEDYERTLKKLKEALCKSKKKRAAELKRMAGLLLLRETSGMMLDAVRLGFEKERIPRHLFPLMRNMRDDFS